MQAILYLKRINPIFRQFLIIMGSIFFYFINGCCNLRAHLEFNDSISSVDIAQFFLLLIYSFTPFGRMIGCFISNQLLKLTQSNLRMIEIDDLIGLVGSIKQILDYNLGNFILGRFLYGIDGGIDTDNSNLFQKFNFNNHEKKD